MIAALQHSFVFMNELELRHELHGVERILHCLTGRLPVLSLTTSVST